MWPTPPWRRQGQWVTLAGNGAPALNGSAAEKTIANRCRGRFYGRGGSGRGNAGASVIVALGGGSSLLLLLLCHGGSAHHRPLKEVAEVLEAIAQQQHLSLQLICKELVFAGTWSRSSLHIINRSERLEGFGFHSSFTTQECKSDQSQRFSLLPHHNQNI